MSNLEEKLARLRSHIHTALVDAGYSVSKLAAEMGVQPPQKLTEWLNHPGDLPMWVLLRLAEVTGKPLWWFLGEPPQGISLEAAEVAVQNVSRIRLYLDAIESEFQRVTTRAKDSYEAEPSVERVMGEVVDLEPYLARARAILQREVESEEPLVSEESIEMVAQGLYSAEMGVVPLRPAPPRDNVRRLPTRD